MTIDTGAEGQSHAVLVPDAPGRVTVTVTLHNGKNAFEQLTYTFDIQLAGGETYRYPQAFKDADGTPNEPNENQSLPPSDPLGDIENAPHLMNADEHYATLSEEAISTGLMTSSYDLNVGVATYGIPAAADQQLAISYEMATEVEDGTLEVVTADGTVLETLKLQQESLDRQNETFALSQDVTQYLNENGALYVTVQLEDESPSDLHSSLQIYYIWIESA